MTLPVSLPALYCPFAAAVSEHAESVDRHTVAWAESFGLFQDERERARFARSRVGWLAARTSPYATPEGLALLADWQMWLFLFDDHCCDEAETGSRPAEMGGLVARYLAILEEPASGRPVPEDDPLTRALRDVHARICAAARPHQQQRFTAAVTGYFLALLWEAGNRAAHLPADLTDYQLMRRHSGAVPTCAALADVARGVELSAEEYAHPAVRSLTARAVNIASWANDILSYPKEVARSTAVHSLPAVLARTRGISAQKALDEAAEMHDAEVHRFEAEDAAARAWAGPELLRYLDDLRHWVRGNLDWSHETARYAVSA